VTSAFFENLPKRKSSAKRRKFAQSGHPAEISLVLSRAGPRLTSFGDRVDDAGDKEFRLPAKKNLNEFSKLLKVLSFQNCVRLRQASTEHLTTN
jgi:hypothetical protein